MDSISQVRERIHQIQALLGEPPQTHMGFGRELQRVAEQACPQALPEAQSVAAERGQRVHHPSRQETAGGYPAALAPFIEEAAGKTGLSEDLLSAVIATESGFRPDAVSRTGAAGLMQLMPGTARALGVDDRFDPRQSILGGAEYLRQQLSRFGTVEKALAAYNAGPGAVAQHHGIPPFAETQNYVQRVMSQLRRWTDRSGGS